MRFLQKGPPKRNDKLDAVRVLCGYHLRIRGYRRLYARRSSRPRRGVTTQVVIFTISSSLPTKPFLPITQIKGPDVLCGQAYLQIKPQPRPWW